jgi:hypothetical protein
MEFMYSPSRHFQRAGGGIDASDIHVLSEQAFSTCWSMHRCIGHSCAVRAGIFNVLEKASMHRTLMAGNDVIHSTTFDFLFHIPTNCEIV